MKINELQPGMIIECKPSDEDTSYIGEVKRNPFGYLYIEDSNGIAYFPDNTDDLSVVK